MFLRAPFGLLLLALTSACGSRTKPFIEELPPCLSNADCQDGIACNGEEVCREGRCRASEAIACDDGDPCTEDFCDEEAGGACSFEPLPLVDADGDGFFEAGLCGDDCDDTRADVFPGSSESCNGLDDDCDLRVDEGADYEPSGMESRLTNSLPPSSRGAPVWSPQTETWGVTFSDGSSSGTSAFFVQLAPDGTPIASATELTPALGDAFAPRMVWGNEEYAVAWEDRRDRVWEIYFNRLTAEGEKLGPDVRITRTDDWSINPDVLFTGGEFVVAWQDWRHRTFAPDNFEIYLAFLDTEGAMIGSEIRLTDDRAASESPRMAMGENEIGITFLDTREGEPAVFFMRVSLLGEVLQEPVRVSPGGTSAVFPTIAFFEGAYALTWQQETVRGDMDILGALVESGTPGMPITLVGGESWSRAPEILVSGESVLVVYGDDRVGFFDIWFSRFDGRFSRLGTDTRASFGGSDSLSPAIGIGGGNIGVVFEDLRDENWENYFTTLGCVGL